MSHKDEEDKVVNFTISFRSNANPDYVLGFVASIRRKYSLTVKGSYLSEFKKRSIYVLNHDDLDKLENEEFDSDTVLIYDINSDGYETGYFVSSVSEFIKGYRIAQVSETVKLSTTLLEYKNDDRSLWISHWSNRSDIVNCEELFVDDDVHYSLERMDEILRYNSSHVSDFGILVSYYRGKNLSELVSN